MFGRNRRSDDNSANASASVTADDSTRDPEAKKNRPTPKRNAQQAARRQSLVPADRKAARRQSREAERRYAAEARRGMIEGDERYLTARDAGPQRRFVRDFVDARFSIGELLIPIAVVVLIITFFANTQMQLIMTFTVYGLFALVILDGFVLNYQLKGRMADRFGGKSNLQRGLTWYAVMRSIQLRPLRTPKPMVKRGAYPN